MSYQEDFDIAQRYDLLCRASQSHVEQEGKRLQLAADLDVLDKIINHDLPELARSGSPDHFADILKSLNLELEHFREFCEFPDLAQKVVVGVGGAFSAGKSSLINTLLGKKRLVVEIDPTTSLPTYLLYGEQEQITALNLFRRRVILSRDEFASLTHEEKIKYGSQIAGLLRSAFVSDPDFAWKNIALLDTPGYSKPDSEQWSERTDESVARSQLNLSNFIIWVVSATQGTISEDDLKFLATLNADIPKLIVVSRADAKTPEDIAKIVALVKQTTAERGVNVLDVVAVSARKKNDYPVQPIVSFLEQWNKQEKALSFAQNFKRQFLEYARFIQGKQQQIQIKLEQINKLLVLSDHSEQILLTERLQAIEKNNNNEWNDLAKNIEELQNKFFNKINQLSESFGFFQEQLIDLPTLLKNPDCSAEVLQRYAEQLTDNELLNLIYQHENCSIPIFEKILSQSTGSVTLEKLQYFLENRNFPRFCSSLNKHLNVIDISQLSVKARVNLAKISTLEEEKQELLYLCKNPLVRKSLTENENLAENLINLLAQDKDPEIKSSLAKNPNISRYIQSILATDESDSVREELANNPNISEAAQLILVQDSKDSVRINLAKNPNISENIQLTLTQDSSENVKYTLALINPNISENVQLFFAQSEDEYARRNLAKNIKINEKVQFILANDSVEEVKENLAENSNLIEKIQLIFAENGSEWIKYNLSSNTSITKAVQLKLVQDNDYWVRIYLYQNTNVDKDIHLVAMDDIDTKNYILSCNKSIVDNTELLNLSESEDVYVLRNLAKNPNINEEIKMKLSMIQDNRIKMNLASNPSLSEAMQNYFLQQSDDDIRKSLAGNHCITEAIQLKLAQDNDDWVRTALAENLNITEIVQLKLSQDTDTWVRKSLYSNVNLSETVQLKCSQYDRFLDDDQNVIDIGIMSGRGKLAENLNITEKVQLEILTDGSPYVRKHLAKNPNITEKVQFKLAQDKNEEVKEALFQNPNLSVKVEQLLS
ncbi:dynamin family protein [Acinetobacter sp. YH12080]|uniref:dynamin family protein n=1 Tax=Acinetobacter sp. YH12080 TaxID=2601073 RepID=UPI0015D18D91|nr:dynamin family protein [Acinetobacter sp. YH12080]